MSWSGAEDLKPWNALLTPSIRQNGLPLRSTKNIIFIFAFCWAFFLQSELDTNCLLNNKVVRRAFAWDENIELNINIEHTYIKNNTNTKFDMNVRAARDQAKSRMRLGSRGLARPDLVTVTKKASRVSPLVPLYSLSQLQLNSWHNNPALFIKRNSHLTHGYNGKPVQQWQLTKHYNLSRHIKKTNFMKLHLYFGKLISKF